MNIDKQLRLNQLQTEQALQNMNDNNVNFEHMDRATRHCQDQLEHGESLDAASLNDLCSTLSNIHSNSQKLKKASATNAQLLNNFDKNSNRMFGAVIGAKHRKFAKALNNSQNPKPNEAKKLPPG